MNITAYGPKGKAVAALDEKFRGGRRGCYRWPLKIAVKAHKVTTLKQLTINDIYPFSHKIKWFTDGWIL
jgi:hypothetical protein